MSLPRVKIADLKPKENIKSVFLIKYIAVMEAKDGKKYLNIVFTDGKSDLEGRSWSQAEQIEQTFKKGDFILAEGKINLFQGRKQFIMQRYETVDSSLLDLDDFIMKSDKDPDKMYDDLISIVKNLDDYYIRELILNIITDDEISRRLKTWQAGKTIHHAYRSGLLEHILSCTNLAVHLSPHYNVNVNYVVAGTILHDLCKVYELTDGVNIEYTEEGKLVGHLVKILEVIDRFSYRIKDFPYQLKLHLKHIMLSHHGHYEYGSPKIPQTSEAMLVHLIDMMDSKMHSFETVKRNDNNTGHWTGFVKHLDRIIYKDELPYFPEPISESHKNTSPKSSGHAKVQGKNQAKEKEIKNNLGSLLKDFKVDE